VAVAADGMDLNHAPDPGLIASLRPTLLAHQVLCICGPSIGPGEFLRDQSVRAHPSSTFRNSCVEAQNVHEAGLVA